MANEQAMSPAPPIAWKISAPPLPEQRLPRERLTVALEAHFDRPRRQGPVALLTAPAGYGKTTLLAEWAHISTTPVAWYTLDETDNDLALFLRGVTRALDSVIARPRWRVLMALDRLPAGIPTASDLDRLIDLFLRDLQRVVSHPATLVLTNLHILQADEPTAKLVEHLLAEPPDPLGLALESREPSHIPATLLHQEQRLRAIGEDELALTDEEFHALLALRGIHLTTQEANKLRTLCGGWIMGVLLATDIDASALLSEKSARPRKFNRDATSEYLARQVIDALPVEERAFAARLAILDPITPSVCARLLDLPDARERLATLDRRLSFFDAAARVADETVYRFHPALRASLLRALKTELTATQVDDLHARAGDILRDCGRDEEAVRHYIQAKRFDRIAALIEERKAALLRSGNGESVVRWIQALPSEMRASRPRLQLALAELHRNAGRMASAWQVTRAVCASVLPQADHEPELAAQAHLMRGMLYHTQGDFERAREDCEQALTLTPEDADDLQIQARFTLISCLAGLNQLDQAEARLSDLERRAHEARDVATLARYWYMRAKVLQVQLRYVASGKAAEQALRCAQEAEDMRIAVSSEIQLGAMLAAQGQFAEALELIDSAREQARRSGYSIGMAYAVLNLGEVERMRGAYDESLAAYYRAQALTERMVDPNLYACVMSGLGFTYILNGRSDLAVSLLRANYESAPDAARQTKWARMALTLGLAYLREGEPADAVEPIERAYAIALKSDDRSLLVDAQLILCALRLAQERDAEATTELLAALHTVSLEDVAPVILQTAQIVAEVFPLAESLKDERASTLLRAQARAERPQPPERESRASSQSTLRVYTFGGARVFEGNIQLGGWRLPAAREMLCYLLDRHEPVRKEALLADLWPDKSDQTANINFRQAVFQLNRVLNRKAMIKREGRWSLSFDGWVDAREFERLAADAKRLATDGDFRTAITAFRQALTYARGSYLADVDSDWARLRAEQLELVRLSCLEQLAELEEQLGRHEEAAQRWFQLLEDPAPHENARRGLMRYYARRGEYVNVRDQYDRLQRELTPAFAPSAETQMLYQELMAQAPLLSGADTQK
ncbi:MAG TPA: BTAD domain-containing putative transcriptional regulator [Ktedonobacterales bacterium]|jgi:ATP/maltotriose-dependent transcriptional regulator MalT/DNA-binding SARP family transcriptional activator